MQELARRMQKRNDDKTSFMVNRLFLRLMAVNVLIGLVLPCTQLIDSVLTGKFLGTAALDVYGLFLPLESLTMALCGVFSIGTQISCSHLLGRGKLEEAQEVSGTAFLAAGVFSVLYFLIMLIFAGEIAVALGANGEIPGQVSDMTSYLQGYAFGIPAIFLMGMMSCLMILEGKRKMSLVMSICVLVVNAVGDLLNIFVFKQGLFGMALATTAAYTVCFIVFALVYLLRATKMFRPSAPTLHFSHLRTILKNGTPSFTYYGSLVVRTAFFNWLILHNFNNDALAVMLVVNRFTTIVDAIIGGVGDSVLLLGGVLYGEKDLKGQRRLLKMALVVSALLFLAISVIAIIASQPIARSFSDYSDPNFITEAARAVAIVSVCFVPDVIACIFKKHIQAVGRPSYTSFTNVVCNVVFACFAAFALVGIIGSDGIYASYSISYLLIMIVHVLYAILLARKSSRKGFDIFLFLPDDYEISENDLWERTVCNLHECVETLDEAHALCRDRGVDNRRTDYVLLLIEETTTNVVEHGISKGEGSIIVVRILFDKDRIILSIKDDCRYFNPITYYASLQGSGNGESDFGLRIVMNVAKKVSYTNCFNLNNLRIEV